jgi:hypothetical protein
VASASRRIGLASVQVLPCALARLRSAKDLTLAFVVLYTMLSGLVGFAHRAVGSATTAPGDAGLVVFADGSGVVICLGSDPVEPGPDSTARPPCDAGLLTATPGLPSGSPAAIAMGSVLLGWTVPWP